jgi:hypothetical protein
MKRTRHFSAMWAALFAAAVAAISPRGATSTWAQSPQFTFRRVAGESTSVPGGSALLDVFTPSLEAGHVSFLGQHDDGQGIYAVSPNGMPSLVADSTTLVPGTMTPFARLGQWHSRDGSRVLFNALAFPESGSDLIEGVYVVEDGMITTIADLNTPLPSGTGNFTSLWNPDESPSADGGRITFVGGGENQEGIYTAHGGTLSRMVDTSTHMPNDTRSFQYFRSPILDGERLAFVADLDDSTQGIYLHNLATGTLSVVADSNTPLPGGESNFGSFGFGPSAILDFEGDIIAFLGNAESSEHGAMGVYRYDISTGALTAVAEAGAPVPGQPAGEFGPYFQSVSVDGGHVAFHYGAFVETHFDEFLTPFYGIYSDLGGALEKVLAPGDVLDGMMVDTCGLCGRLLDIGAEALDGNQIAILVQFEDDSRAIFIAKLIPEPATKALLLPAALVVAFGWRRSNQSIRDAEPAGVSMFGLDVVGRLRFARRRDAEEKNSNT